MYAVDFFGGGKNCFLKMTLHELTETAVKAALKGGKVINEVYESPDSDFKVEIKADNSPLTIADKRSDKEIRELLESTEIPVLSEEMAAAPYEQRGAWNLLWIVDPLDGTKEFVGRRDDFTVNIALVEGHTPVAGVVYLPVFKTLYFALKGEGSFRVDNVGDDEDVPLTSLIARGHKLPLDRGDRPYTCVASVSHMNEDTRLFIEELKLKHPDLKTVSRGSSIKICLVAEGSADIYPRFGPTMEWDTAAGHAVALMAGHDVVEADGGARLAYNKKDLLNPHFIVR